MLSFKNRIKDHKNICHYSQIGYNEETLLLYAAFSLRVLRRLKNGISEIVVVKGVRLVYKFW